MHNSTSANSFFLCDFDSVTHWERTCKSEASRSSNARRINQKNKQTSDVIVPLSQHSPGGMLLSPRNSLIEILNTTNWLPEYPGGEWENVDRWGFLTSLHVSMPKPLLWKENNTSRDELASLAPVSRRIYPFGECFYKGPLQPVRLITSPSCCQTAIDGRECFSKSLEWSVAMTGLMNGKEPVFFWEKRGSKTVKWDFQISMDQLHQLFSAKSQKRIRL